MNQPGQNEQPNSKEEEKETPKKPIVPPFIPHPDEMFKTE